MAFSCCRATGSPIPECPIIKAFRGLVNFPTELSVFQLSPVKHLKHLRFQPVPESLENEDLRAVR